MNDNNKDTSNYEPNFVLTPSDADQAEAAAEAEAAEGVITPDKTVENTAAEATPTEDAKAGQAEATKAEDAQSGKADNPAAKPEAAEPKAEEPKAAEPEAVKPEAPQPSYEPNFILKPSAPEKPEKNEPAATSETAAASETSTGSAASTESASTTAAKTSAAGPAPDRFSRDPYSRDPYSRETADMSSIANETAGAGEAARSGGPSGGAAGAARSAAAGMADAARSAAAGAAGAFAGAAGRSAYENRPKYENPSFDPGQTGHYTDPRDRFRGTESASWSNGEFHSNRKAVRDSIHKQQKQQKKKPAPVMLTRRALGLLIAGCLCLSCLFGLGGAALGYSMMHQHNEAATAQTATAAASANDSAVSNAGYTLEEATGSNMTVKEITAAAKNSVVEIRTEAVSSDTWMQQYVTEGAGSGVIISEDGYIMTNNHVIEGASKIKVTTADEKEYEAELIGTDDTNDVAVIKIKASGLTPATYGNSDNLEVGDLAVAIGNPLGELGGTVTAGIISATDRELAIDGKTLHLLQTDSSINPGNSGGGLFNSNGQLIGLVVAKSAGSDVEGLGFAIPINTAADVAQQLKDKGYVSGQPSTGMTYTEGSFSNNGDTFNSFDSFFGGGNTGVFIYSVNGENAKEAGFQAGDQVYAVDGEEIGSFDDLSAIVTAHKVGDKLTFTIIRNGTQKNIKLELEEKQAVPDTQSTGGQNGQDQNGQGQNNQDQNGVPNGQNGADGNAPGNGQDQPQSGLNPGSGQQDIESWSDLFNNFFW